MSQSQLNDEIICTPLSKKRYINSAKPGQFIQNWPFLVSWPFLFFSLLFLIKPKSKKETDTPETIVFFFVINLKSNTKGEGKHEIIFGFSSNLKVNLSTQKPQPVILSSFLSLSLAIGSSWDQTPKWGWGRGVVKARSAQRFFSFCLSPTFTPFPPLGILVLGYN